MYQSRADTMHLRTLVLCLRIIRSPDIDRHFVHEVKNNHIEFRDDHKTFIDMRRHTTYAGDRRPKKSKKATKAPISALAIVQINAGTNCSHHQSDFISPSWKRRRSNPAPAPPKVASIRDIKPLPEELRVLSD